jgi:hypothetical protein
VAIGGLGFDGLDIALRGLPVYAIGRFPGARTRILTVDGSGGRGRILVARSVSRHSWLRTTRGLPGLTLSLLPLGGCGSLLMVPCGSLPPGMRLLAVRKTSLGKCCFACLPAGARGTALAPGELARLVGELGCWREIGGISDALLAGDGQGGDGGMRAEQAGGLSLDDGLLGSWTGAFGWLVVADPVMPQELRGLAEDVGVGQRVAEASVDRFPERAVQVRRLKGRQAELQRGGSGGFWRISVMAGGADEVSAARVAGLFCASTDLSGLPYALSPAPVAGVRPGERPSCAATAILPRRSTGRPSCSPRSSGRRRLKFPGCASRCGRNST